jgi:hypothetical protein
MKDKSEAGGNQQGKVETLDGHWMMTPPPRHSSPE